MSSDRYISSFVIYLFNWIGHTGTRMRAHNTDGDGEVHQGWRKEKCERSSSQSMQGNISLNDKRSAVGDPTISMQDVQFVGDPCKVIIRSREARTPWENVVKAVVGNPVHVDIVLAKEGSSGARFCFSSYMNHKFEMTMMTPNMIHDSCFSNLCLYVTDRELERCTQFLTALDGKASYSYFDALVLMPMAPKVCAEILLSACCCI